MERFYKYSQLTGKIIGAAMEVHKYLGDGFQEVIYQRALSFELENAGLAHLREIETDIYYKDIPQPIGARRVDFIVEERVLVELKAVKELEDGHIAQILNYLRAYRFEVGLLINFGAKSLEFRRFVMSKRY